MTHRSLAALILLNTVLLAALVVTSFSPPRAHAQLGGGTQFMMISGAIQGRNSLDGIYIIDRRTTRMIAETFDSRNQEFDIIGGRNMRRDVQRGTQRR